MIQQHLDGPCQSRCPERAPRWAPLRDGPCPSSGDGAEGSLLRALAAGGGTSGGLLRGALLAPRAKLHPLATQEANQEAGALSSVLPCQSVMECSPAWKVKSITETIAAPWKQAVMKRTCTAAAAAGRQGCVRRASGGAVERLVIRLSISVSVRVKVRARGSDASGLRLGLGVAAGGAPQSVRPVLPRPAPESRPLGGATASRWTR